MLKSISTVNVLKSHPDVNACESAPTVLTLKWNCTKHSDKTVPEYEIIGELQISVERYGHIYQVGT